MLLLFDVDGVLAQWKKVFKKHLLDVGFEVDGIGWESPDLPCSKSQREYAWLKISEPGVAYEFEPFPESIETVKRISRLPGISVYFVTAQVQRSRTWAFDRANWLIKHFGEELGSNVVFTHHKHLVRGDVLIDDKEYNIKSWKEANPDKLAILWDHPHNREYNTVGVRMGDWDHLYDKISRMI